MLVAIAVILFGHLFSHSPDLLRGTYEWAELRTGWSDELPLLLVVLFGAYAHRRSENGWTTAPAPAGWFGRLPGFVRYLLYLVVCLLSGPVVFTFIATLFEYGFGHSGKDAAATAETISYPAILAVALYLFVVYEGRFPGKATAD
ncbi:hypothetical protein [Lewinella sp. IMCC34183]|uniref:hypothetical protein n=1 Tax=Lewinella sp. IMCC34183 TaxID=2248762 RepID=UPI0013004C9C|nr:hypothetical protein [Lewinella sp. IMCC34183]